jgi:hypothetical protein
MKNPAFVAWIALRMTRWACSIAFLAYAFATTLDRPAYLNQFGQPLHRTEAWLFGLIFAAAAAGFLEMMMRERAGVERPDAFKLMPPKKPTTGTTARTT